LAIESGNIVQGCAGDPGDVHGQIGVRIERECNIQGDLTALMGDRLYIYIVFSETDSCCLASLFYSTDGGFSFN
jgi:hypothetical protein